MVRVGDYLPVLIKFAEDEMASKAGDQKEILMVEMKDVCVDRYLARVILEETEYGLADLSIFYIFSHLR